jgi:hypothetical protein
MAQAEVNAPVNRGHPDGVLRQAAGVVAGSALLRHGKRLWLANEKNWSMPLSKWDKLWAGAYLILKGYSAGLFPPTVR